MSEQAKSEALNIYHIFLDSPGDMNDERQVMRKFLGMDWLIDVTQAW